MNKGGLSTVVTTVIMIALVVVAIAIIWAFVDQLIKTNTEKSKSCSNIYGKITINNRYTCYNSTSKEFMFSVKIGDIDIDELLVSISGDMNSKSFKLDNNGISIAALKNTTGSSIVKLPGKNGGSTYIYNMTEGGFSGKPDSIELAPIINKNQCEISDSLSEIDDCSLLV